MGSSTATIPFPRSRLGTLPVARLGARHHATVALLEIDITKARRRMLPQAPGTTSLLSWLAGQIAVSIRTHPEVESTSRRRTPNSESVHVRVMVERTLGDRRICVPLLLAHADSRSTEEMAEQIDAARQEPLDEAQIVLGRFGRRICSMLCGPFRALPPSIRMKLVNRAVAAPRHLHIGPLPAGRTVTVSSLGPGVRVRGWYIPRAQEPVAVGVGAVGQKAAVINGRIEPREILHLSVLLEGNAETKASRWLSSLIKGMEGAFTAEAVF